MGSIVPGPSGTCLIPSPLTHRLTRPVMTSMRGPTGPGLADLVGKLGQGDPVPAIART